MEKDKALVLDVADVMALEKYIDRQGTPLEELMLRAGDAVAHCIKERLAPASKILMFAGYGNNGGDAWVAAFGLARNGYKVTLVSPLEPERIKSEPARSVVRDLIDGLHNASNEVEGGSLQICVCPDNMELEELLDWAEAVADGMLGTGFSGDDVREPFATWIRACNDAREGLNFLLAIDAPSGLSAQTGKAANPCFKADMTLTMIVKKSGLVEPGAREYVGALAVAPLVEDPAFYVEGLFGKADD